MANIHLAPKSNKKWLMLAGLAAVIGVVACWWLVRSDDPVVAALPSAAVPGAASAADAVSPPPISQAKVDDIMVEQSKAAKEIDREPDMKPIPGPIKDRPAFVSVMEWAMLKGVAQQNATPDQELTRLVNFLRFTKQLELWQSLAKSSDVGKRQLLANQLLEDLPQRVIHEEYDLKEARQTQAALLIDAVPDPQARQQRAALEAKRLEVPAKPANNASQAHAS